MKNQNQEYNAVNIIISMQTDQKYLNSTFEKRRKSSLECKRYNITCADQRTQNKTMELLTCFTVSAGKARLTVALVFMMDVFITSSSVFTLVIFVTMQFCNT